MALFLALVLAAASLLSLQARADDEGGPDPGDLGSGTPRYTAGSAFGTGSNEEILNPGAPTGYDENDTTNPLGLEPDKEVLMFSQAELFAYYSEEPDSSSKSGIEGTVHTDVYHGLQEKNDKHLVDGSAWEKKTNVDYGQALDNIGALTTANYTFVQAVSFDPTDSGLDDHVAMIGVTKDSSGNKTAGVWVYKPGDMASPVYTLGNVSWMKDYNDKPGEETLASIASNFLSITAGDYDDDGKDTIVVYAALDGADFSLTELSVDSKETAITLTALGTSKDQLHPGYVANSTMGTPLCNDSSYTGRSKLGCDLTSGDLNMDGIDDLAVISYVNHLEFAYFAAVGGEYLAKPYLAVVKGVKDLSGSVLSCESNYTSVSTEYKDITEQGQTQRNYSCDLPLSPSLTIGDIDGDGCQELVVAGMNSTIKTAESSGVMKIISGAGWTSTDVKTFFGVYRNTDTNPMACTLLGSGTPAAAFESAWENQRDGEDVYVYTKLGTTAVAINGVKNVEYVFAAGKLYDLSQKVTEVYTVPCFSSAIPDSFFGAKTKTEVIFINSACALAAEKDSPDRE